jgi:hypothetical protein
METVTRAPPYAIPHALGSVTVKIENASALRPITAA